MTALVAALGVLTVVALVAEVVVRGATVLARLPTVVAIFFAGAAIAIAVWIPLGGGSVACLLALWLAGFTLWLVVRSHVSSSISLRMAWMLARRPMSEPELLARYDEAYGAVHRGAQLRNAGLGEGAADGVRPTARGRWIVLLARALARRDG
ncbi:MAG: hypothetical protein AB7S26_09610 [Sandaracinaceae bacterium]